MNIFFAIVLFAITYVSLLVFSKYRAYIALGSAALFTVLSGFTVTEFFGAIDFNVLLMLLGTMGTVVMFIDSGMPARLADEMVHKVPNMMWAIILLSFFAGLISAFVDNVATVLMVAPVALAICKRQNTSPVLPIIAIAVSSNLQGAATLVGDTTSILLGGYANMDFADFFWFHGKMGIFFAVEIGAILSTCMLLFLFRDKKQPLSTEEKTKVTDYVPTIALVGTVIALIFASLSGLTIKIGSQVLINGIICTALFLICLIYSCTKKNPREVLSRVFGELDYQTILLLSGLFVVIAGITKAGVIDKFAELIVGLGNNDVFLTYTIIVLASVLLSAFIDNIPYVATMLPVVAGVSAIMGIEPYILYFGLLIGATLGGNLTPIGASANIAAIGILRKSGYEVKVKEFMKIGVPFTLVAVLSGYIVIWFIWGF